ncbi:MAG TPA: hypothetical protein VK735_40210 [Pseudonocardia sp.]|uniref:hypothetical protein n=1 Tax=Pseudonocardia sp. TaxID=60912 RepID=UPI002B52009E|nr:hypothetical protein [Pseudonocardia sp.]HTF53710.1 hypothetical protein [Pseudonocardia sp.]
MPNLVTLTDISGRLIVVEPGSAAEANARAHGYKNSNFLNTDAEVEAAKAQVVQQDADDKALIEAGETAAKEKLIRDEKARVDARAKADEVERNKGRPRG